MTNKTTILVWFIFTLLSTTVACVTLGSVCGLELIPDSLMHLMDRGPVTVTILIVFSVGLLINVSNTMFVVRQMSLVAQGVTYVRLPNRNRVAGRGLLGMHIDRLYDMFGESGSENVSQTISLNALRNQLFRREWVVRSSSSLLLTLGLVGTVVGLTDSLGGLSATINAVATETLRTSGGATATEDDSHDKEKSQSAAGSADMSSGLNKALGGMASAFITTLFGAVLGAVFLKVLCTCTDCMIEELLDQIEITTEARVIPLLKVSPHELLRRQERAFREWATKMEQAATRECDRLADVSAHLVQITRRFAQLSRAIAQAESQLAGSKNHLALLSRVQQTISKWNSFLGSRSARITAAACCIVAAVGIVRVIVDFTF